MLKTLLTICANFILLLFLCSESMGALSCKHILGKKHTWIDVAVGDVISIRRNTPRIVPTDQLTKSKFELESGSYVVTARSFHPNATSEVPTNLRLKIIPVPKHWWTVNNLAKLKAVPKNEIILDIPHDRINLKLNIRGSVTVNHKHTLFRQSTGRSGNPINYLPGTLGFFNGQLGYIASLGPRGVFKRGEFIDFGGYQATFVPVNIDEFYKPFSFGAPVKVQLGGHNRIKHASPLILGHIPVSHLNSVSPKLLEDQIASVIKGFEEQLPFIMRIMSPYNFDGTESEDLSRVQYGMSSTIDFSNPIRNP